MARLAFLPRPLQFGTRQLSREVLACRLEQPADRGNSRPASPIEPVIGCALSTDGQLSISVIIPVHRGGEDFRRCLMALTDTSPAPGEIIVVADGDDGSSGQVAEAFDVRVIDLPSRVGPAGARNQGAREAGGEILFFVDADVLVRPDTVGQVAEHLGQEPDLAAIFGSYDDTPAAPNFLSQYKNLLHHYVHQTAEEEASTFWSGCGAIRSDLFLALGGFDAGYERPAIEDIELGYRLVREGYRIRLCKALQVKHLKRWGVRSLVSADFFSRALPWTELILRDRRFVNDLNLRTSSRLSVILVYAFLGTLAAAVWWPGFLLFSLAASLLLLALNAPLYRFFLQKRGLWFALRAIPWHWFYYFYSGLAFVIGGLRHLLRRGAPSGHVQSAAQCQLPQTEPDSE